MSLRALPLSKSQTPSSLPPFSVVFALAKRMRPSALDAPVFRRGATPGTGSAPHAANTAATAPEPASFSTPRRDSKLTCPLSPSRHSAWEGEPHLGIMAAVACTESLQMPRMSPPFPRHVTEGGQGVRSLYTPSRAVCHARRLLRPTDGIRPR